MNLFSSLEATATRSPQKNALIEEDTVVTYAELLRRVNEFSEHIRGLGICPGNRIGLAFPNGIAYVALTYALWQCGAVVVPIPTECSADEVAEITSSMQLQGLITATAPAQGVAFAPDCFFVSLQPVSSPDNHGINLAFIRFTSGTTSARKGVALSHETIHDRVRSANQAFGLTADDTVIWCLPMAHHFLITIVLYLEVGAAIVLARHVTAKPFLEAVQRWQGTVLYAAPFHFAMLARDRSDAQISSVRLAVSTTCALPETVVADFLRRYQRPLAQALGVIELGLVAVNIAAAQTKWNSVGKAAGEFELRLDQPDAEGCGELVVCGPGICDAYVAPWLPREQILRDGWFYTGDIGRLDADGDLFLLSRKTAVINLAGRKVFPEEIESVINQHSDVAESRVYGRPHPHLGEVVEAEIVLRADGNLDAVRGYCRDRLASYKIPTRFTVVPSLPRTAVTGKLLRTPNAI